MFGRAGKDAVGAVEVTAKLLCGYFLGLFTQEFLVTDTFEGKTAQTIGLMTPGIEVPGVTVLRQPLR